MHISIKHLALIAPLLSLTVHAQGSRPDRYGYGSDRPKWTGGSKQTSVAYAGGPATATIDIGVLHGTSTSLPLATASVNQFLGVPYAKNPPVRFGPPEPAESIYGPLNVTSFSPSCYQQFTTPNTAILFNDPAPVESESCLYLNVFAPSTPAPADGRPVLFWIYGGGLQFGNAGQPVYDGSSFAAFEDLVIVTTNYRLNVFGFPNSPELPSDAQNLGLLDQRLALDWVQRNIHAFGGSPDKVTVFGESAGAFSTDMLLTSFPADSTPPFRGAILQSGQYSYRPAPFTSLESSWYALSSALGCPGSFNSNLTCIRAANASLIKQIVGEQFLTFQPYPDNVTLVSNPAERRLNGEIARVPVLGGTNADEGRIFKVVAESAAASIGLFFGNNQTVLNTILAAYPIGSPGIANAEEQAYKILTDILFQCAAARWAKDSAAVGIPTWRYFFNSSFTNLQTFPELGVYHASELGLVFNTYPTTEVTTQEYALAETLRSTWAKFARNPQRGPGWNQVGTGTTGTVLVGVTNNATGGILNDANSVVQNGTFNLAVLGNRGDVFSSGVTIVDPSEVDFRCSVYDSIYDANNNL